MITATGTFKGVDVERKALNVNDVIKEYGLKVGEKVEFELTDNMKSWDPLNKVTKHPQRMGKGNEIVGRNKDGSTIILRFSNRAPREDKKTGLIKSEPHHYFYEGDKMLLHTSANMEHAIFFMLHPSCEQSPFVDGRKTEWRVVDRKAEAAKANEKMSNIIDLIAEVKNETSITKLRRIAYGLKIVKDGRTITMSGVKEKEPEQLVVELCKIAMDSPEEFALAYRDSNTMLMGMVKDATESNLLVLRGVGGGLSRWYWSKDINGGAPFCDVQNGSEPLGTLFNHVHGDSGYLQFITTLDQHSNFEGVEKLMVTASTEKDPSDMTGIELVRKAILDDIIYFDRNPENPSVKLLNKDGAIEEQGLHKVTDTKNWQALLADALNEKGIKRNRVIKRLKNEE